MKINIIAAMDLDRNISKDGSLPWCNQDEMSFFRNKTLGKIVLMGRNTALSLPNGKLNDRINIILSKNKNNSSSDHVFYHSNIDSALKKCEEFLSKCDNEVWIIGGLNVYNQFIPFADKIFLSEIQSHYNGDMKFPYINMNVWDLISKYSPHETFKVYEYKRRF